MAERSSVALAGGNYSVKAQIPWDGRLVLPGTLERPLAFDCETSLIDRSVPAHVPELALCTACWGSDAVMVWPEQLPLFIRLHEGKHLVGHNIAFDYWAVRKHLESEGVGDALRLWDDAFDKGLAHDTMILDMLLELAEAKFPLPGKDDHLRQRNLAEVCDAHLGKGLVDKTDPYRVRYSEVIEDREVLLREPGFWEYALRDALATHLLWSRMYAKAMAVNARGARHGLFKAADAARNVREYGPLTESLQVRGACALAAAERRGMRVDRKAAAAVKTRLEGEIAGAEATMLELFPSVFKRHGGKDVSGQCFLPGAEPPLRYTKSGAPCLDSAEMRRVLEVCSAANHKDPLLQTKGAEKNIGRTSLETKRWAARAGDHDFIRAWTGMGKTSKLLSLQKNLASSAEAHPGYVLLKRTGRVSARGANIMQAPRADWFRSQFVARPGHLLYTVDLAYIELRTFAAVCEKTLGFSEMGRQIRAGRDPHTHSASILMGVKYEEAVAGIKAEKAAAKAAEALGKAKTPAPFSSARQSAKIFNFGTLGGLGHKKLVDYALASYGVVLTEDEAKAIRKKVIHDIYPEIGRYLEDAPLLSMAYNLSTGPKELEARLRCSGRRLSYILEGDRPAHEGFWAALEAACLKAPAPVRRLATNHKPQEALADWLTAGPSPTLTGRIRGGCRYTQLKNHPFQALAADGAKLALWRLVREGYHVAAFVHDEFVVELPEKNADVRVIDVDRALCEEMSRACGGFPIEVEGRLGRAWSK